MKLFFIGSLHMIAEHLPKDVPPEVQVFTGPHLLSNYLDTCEEHDSRVMIILSTFEGLYEGHEFGTSINGKLPIVEEIKTKRADSKRIVIGVTANAGLRKQLLTAGCDEACSPEMASCTIDRLLREREKSR